MHLIDQQLDLMIRGRFDEAWQISEMLEKEDPQNLRHLFNRGWFLIHQGKFREGFTSLEAGRFLNVYGGGRLNTTKPIWNPEESDLKDKIVVINSEGGYGDQIIYARFATEVHKRGGKCVLCCNESIKSVFSRVPHVYKCVNNVELNNEEYDFWIPGFSCSWLFGYGCDDMPNAPYLSANPASVNIWRQLIKAEEGKLKVGIRWSGSPKFEHQQFRIFPPEPLIDLYKNDKLKLFSLQKDNDTRELPEQITDLQHLLISWEDTAAVIENLDLVITSCTSVAHLASAMGKPTWVIVPILPYHIWAYGDEHSPWYQKTTRVFRQKKFGEWTDTFVELNKALDNYLAQKKL